MADSIYGCLYQFNCSLRECKVILERIRKFSHIDKKKFRAYEVEVEFLRAEVSQDVAEIMDQIESKNAHKFWLEKKTYDDSLGDPDDVYFDVIQREEERRKQGLPPRIGIVPHLAIADEEKRIEEEQERKKQPTAKRRK
jgi:hypothetical protein